MTLGVEDMGKVTIWSSNPDAFDLPILIRLGDVKYLFHSPAPKCNVYMTPFSRMHDNKAAVLQSHHRLFIKETDEERSARRLVGEVDHECVAARLTGMLSATQTPGFI